MTDLSDLLQLREKLSKRLETIEAALENLQHRTTQLDADIAAAKRARQQVTRKGREVHALLLETRRELERQDELIQQCVEEIAAARIGVREGVYVMGRFAVARMVAGGELYTSLVEVVDSG